MPYQSKQQQRYFNANRARLEAEGVDVDAWNAASRGKRLPQRAKTASALAHELVLSLTKRASTYDPEAFLRSLDNPPQPPQPPPPEPEPPPFDDAALRAEFDPSMRRAREQALARREEAEAAQRSLFTPDAEDIALRDSYESAQRRGLWTPITQQQYDDAVRRISQRQAQANASFASAAHAVAAQQSAADMPTAPAQTAAPGALPPAPQSVGPVHRSRPGSVPMGQWPAHAARHVSKGLRQTWGIAKRFGQQMVDAIRAQHQARASHKAP